MNLGENVGKLTGISWSCLQRCCMNVMFKQGPGCQKIFSCPGPVLQSDVVRFPSIPGAMLLKILLNVGPENVSECPTGSQLDSVGASCQSRNGNDCILL